MPLSVLKKSFKGTDFSTIAALLAQIGSKNTVHAKSLATTFAQLPESELTERAERLDAYLDFLSVQGMSCETAINDYLLVVEDTFREQVHFLRTGKYRCSSFAEAAETVYANPSYMRRYMVGLALTQILWENHWLIFTFFSSAVRAKCGSYLEIGPGHGLFLLEALLHGKFSSLSAIDISETSLSLSKSLIEHLEPAKQAIVAFHNKDIFTFNPSALFDFIALGEVLEHLENPGAMLLKVRSLLAPGGRLFVSTCTNCPAVDHIYLFNDTDEIRSLFLSCQLIVETEAALPAGNLTFLKDGNARQAVNYCAILRAQ